MNETSRIAKLQELATLNGGIAIEFTDTVYALPDKEVLSFDELRTEAMQSDPQLQTLRSDQTTALRQLSVNKAKGLPGFELGYRMNPPRVESVSMVSWWESPSRCSRIVIT